MGHLSLPKLLLGTLVGPFGYRLAPINTAADQQFSPEHAPIIERVKPFTMTSPARIAATCQAVDHVVRYSIPGDFVECGVWRGGSAMAAAFSFLRHGSIDRKLYLFDTFEGMSSPAEIDREIATGEAASTLLATTNRDSLVWAFSPIDNVRRNVLSTTYPAEQFVFAKGRVEDTIPDAAPDVISILRLDTDWYESTRHELEHLFPLLSVGGVLIIDDYGHWAGAKKAVNEYFADRPVPMLLARSDYTGRIGMKMA